LLLSFGESACLPLVKVPLSLGRGRPVSDSQRRASNLELILNFESEFGGGYLPAAYISIPPTEQRATRRLPDPALGMLYVSVASEDAPGKVERRAFRNPGKVCKRHIQDNIRIPILIQLLLDR
jgi:hypothetical protein